MSGANKVGAGVLDLAAANRVPIGEDDADLQEGSPKRRGHGLPVGDTREPKRREGEPRKTCTLDMEMMQSLLDNQREAILQANRQHMDSMLHAFDQKNEARFLANEAVSHDLGDRVQKLESAIATLTKTIQDQGAPAGKTSGGLADRRFTLLFGGWNRDTRKKLILDQLEDGLKALQLRGHLDSEPFCTGPRRSTALCVFHHRQGEGDREVKQRMIEVIKGVSSRQVLVEGGRRMFATFSKTPQEREVAAHASLIKRLVEYCSTDLLPNFDGEYTSGTSWLGDSCVASVTRPVPPGIDMRYVSVDEDKNHKPWIDLQGLSKELNITIQEVRDGIEAVRR